MPNRVFEAIDSCKKCELNTLVYNVHTKEHPEYGKLLTNLKNKVIGSKKLLLIGMNPSYRRFDDKRRAFEGVSPSKNLKDIQTSGDFFDYVLRKTKLMKYTIFITNLVKCSTDKNTELKDKYINTCRYLLELEIGVIKPHYIVSMGHLVKKHLERFNLQHRTFHINHPSYYFRFKSDRAVEQEIEELNKLEESIKNDKSTLSNFQF